MRRPDCQGRGFRLHLGECTEILAGFPAESIDTDRTEEDRAYVTIRGKGGKTVRMLMQEGGLHAIDRWLEAERPKVLPKSPMGMAISYSLSNWEALERYTEDGGRDPDNNEAERAIRPVAIGRKNWLFCGSDNGGRTAAVLMSICASCKQHGVNTFAYIRDMLVRVSTESASRVRELLPDRWKAESEAAAREVAAAVHDPPA